MSVRIKCNLSDVRQRLQYAKDNLVSTQQEAMMNAANQVASVLNEAAPRGKGSNSKPIAGDAPGPLSQSFQAENNSSENVKVRILTTQPTKLKFVRYGTGLYGPNGTRIVPTTMKALYWQEALHPVRSIAGMKPNDFVTPVMNNVKRTIPEAVRQATIDLIGGAFTA